jgi:23S rRNA (cytidine1920-2'-O)/16S rRNA (cytidine1409-2'-O)-methyltransferase
VEAIEAGRVLVGGAPATSAARQVADGDAEHELPAPAGDAYVSRGGRKLAAALDAFAIDVANRTAVDVGASTGGFTDCLLQRGAARVVAIDVGRGQLAWSLRTDSRVTVMERVNVRDLHAPVFDPAPTICTVDVSFISLRTIAQSLLAIAAPDADFVLLVKPQFEAGREHVGKGGIVRDAAVHRDVLRTVVSELAEQGLGVSAIIASPLRGADGNLEFLARAIRGAAAFDIDRVDEIVHDAA